MHEEEVMALYYLKDDNVFMDGEGEIVFEIFEVISPNDLYLFRLNKDNMIVNHHTIPGMCVELYWPDEGYVEIPWHGEKISFTNIY
jgi:hypothetical protein